MATVIYVASGTSHVHRLVISAPSLPSPQPPRPSRGHLRLSRSSERTLEPSLMPLGHLTFS